MQTIRNKSCSVIDDKNVEINESLISSVRSVIRHLLDSEHVLTFVFGGNNKFCSLCHRIINEFKEEYWGIELIYVIKDTNDIYKSNKILHSSTSVTLFSPNTQNIKKSKILLNQFLIDMSKFCILYDDCKNKKIPLDKQTNSVSTLAYQYAKKQAKTIYSL